MVASMPISRIGLSIAQISMLTLWLVDGKFIQSVGWEGEVTETSYYIDYENEQVYVVSPFEHSLWVGQLSKAQPKSVEIGLSQW